MKDRRTDSFTSFRLLLMINVWSFDAFKGSRSVILPPFHLVMEGLKGDMKGLDIPTL